MPDAPPPPGTGPMLDRPPIPGTPPGEPFPPDFFCVPGREPMPDICADAGSVQNRTARPRATTPKESIDRFIATPRYFLLVPAAM